MEWSLFLFPRANVVRITASSRACGPGASSRPTGWVRPAAAGPCTVIISSDQLRRVLNPNIPPSYDQAVTGKDKSVKLEEGRAQGQGPAALENVVLEDSPPAYTPISESAREFPLTSPAPLPTYSSHVSDDGMLDNDDDEPLLTWIKPYYLVRMISRVLIVHPKSPCAFTWKVYRTGHIFHFQSFVVWFVSVFKNYQ